MTKDEIREKLRAEALKQLGKPYKYGAYWQEAPERFDCSSYVQWLYKQVGTQIPRVSIEQAAFGRRVKPVQSALRVGDLVFLRGKVGRYNRKFPAGIGHVVMVIGENEFIHAKSKTKKGKEAGFVMTGKISVLLKRGGVTVVKRLV